MIVKNSKIAIYGRYWTIFKMEKRKEVLYYRVVSITEISVAAAIDTQ